MYKTIKQDVLMGACPAVIGDARLQRVHGNWRASRSLGNSGQMGPQSLHSGAQIWNIFGQLLNVLNTVHDCCN